MNNLAKTFFAGALALTGIAFASAAQAQNMRNAPAYQSQADEPTAGDWRGMGYSSQYRQDDIKGRYNGFSQSKDGNGYIFN